MKSLRHLKLNFLNLCAVRWNTEHIRFKIIAQTAFYPIIKTAAATPIMLTLTNQPFLNFRTTPSRVLQQPILNQIYWDWYLLIGVL